MIMKK